MDYDEDRVRQQHQNHLEQMQFHRRVKEHHAHQETAHYAEALMLERVHPFLTQPVTITPQHDSGETPDGPAQGETQEPLVLIPEGEASLA